MVRGRRKPREYLSASGKADLLSQKKELETTLKEREAYGAGTRAEQIDISKIRQEIAYIDKAIEDREPPKVRGTGKDRLVKEAEELKAKILEGMPTRYEMDFPHKSPGSVNKHLSWARRNVQNLERWREVQLTLNPEAPESIESYRLEK